MEEKRVRKLTFRDFGVTGRHDISSFIAPSEGAILGITEKEDLPEIMEHMLSIVKGYSTCFVYDLDHVLHVVSHKEGAGYLVNKHVISDNPTNELEYRLDQLVPMILFHSRTQHYMIMQEIAPDKYQFVGEHRKKRPNAREERMIKKTGDLFGYIEKEDQKPVVEEAHLHIYMLSRDFSLIAHDNEWMVNRGLAPRPTITFTLSLADYGKSVFLAGLSGRADQYDEVFERLKNNLFDYSYLATVMAEILDDDQLAVVDDDGHMIIVDADQFDSPENIFTVPKDEIFIALGFPSVW